MHTIIFKKGKLSKTLHITSRENAVKNERMRKKIPIHLNI